MKLIGNPIWGDKRYGPGDKATDIYELTLQDWSRYKADYDGSSLLDGGDVEGLPHIYMCFMGTWNFSSSTMQQFQ